MYNSFFKSALVYHATSKTERYFVGDKGFDEQLQAFENTMRALAASYGVTNKVTASGYQYDVTEYQIPGSIFEAIKAARVYLNSRAELSKEPLLKLREDQVDTNNVMTPHQVKRFIDRYNENQNDCKLNLVSIKLEPSKVLAQIGELRYDDYIYVLNDDGGVANQYILGLLFDIEVDETLLKYAPAYLANSLEAYYAEVFN